MLVLLMIIFLGLPSLSFSESLSYSGRLVNPNGSPVSGSVTLLAELAYSGNTASPLCTQELSNVNLTNGVFHLKLDFTCSPLSLEKVLADIPGNETLAIRITDVTHSKVYSYQTLHAYPFARVASVAKKLTSQGATAAGQVLTWDGSKWIAKALPTGSGEGGSSEIADGSIPRSKLQGGSSNRVLVNDALGNIAEASFLSLSQGGTGANTVGGARANLGIVIGTGPGQFMGADAVPSCAPHEKLSMTPGPAYVWSCISDGSGSLSGDVSGALNATSVDKIKGSPIQLTTPVSGNIFKFNGSNWINTSLIAADIPSLSISKLTSGLLPVGLGGTNNDSLVGNRIMVSTPTAIREAAALSNGQLLIGATGAAPVAASLVAGAGISITNAPGSITISASGSGGGVSSVSGTAPISVSNGGSNAVVSLPAASSSSNGYLSAADWTSFNNKQDSLSAGANINGIIYPTTSAETLQIPLAPVLPSDAVNKQYVDSFGQWGMSSGHVYRTSGNVGIGLANPAFKLQIEDIQSDATQRTLVTRLVAKRTTNGSNSNIGIDGRVSQVVAPGVANTGNVLSLWIGAQRNSLNTENDSGSLSLLRGASFQYGHFSGNPSATPTTTTVYGLQLTPYFATGSIGTIYDLFIDRGAVGGNVTRHYGLYVEGTQKINVMDGNLGIGTNTPRSKLEVMGGIQIGDDAATCDATKVGGIRYNSNSVQYCNGSLWQAMGSGAGSPLPAMNNGQLLIGSTGNSPVAANLTAGTGVSIVNSAGGITISATGSGGTVTSVSAAAPISVTNNTTTPAISIAQASSSTDGYLSSANWTTFNSKQSALSAGATINGITYPASSLQTMQIPLAPVNATDAVNKQYVDSFGQWQTASGNVFRTTGNVGIGTNAPDDILSITKSGGRAQASMRSFSSVHHDSAGIIGYRARGTASAPEQVQAGDRLVHVLAQNAMNPVSVSAPGFHVTATENHTASAQGAGISLSVVPNGTAAAVTGMRINHNGHVGMGTISPEVKLDVHDGSLMNNTVARFVGWGGSSLLLQSSNSDGLGNALSWLERRWIFQVDTDGASAGTPQDAITIMGSGNVGIGTTSPRQKLHVAGNIQSNQEFVTSLTVNDGWVIGDWFELVQANPGAVGGASQYEVSVSGTRNSWVESTIYHLSGAHAASDIWREANLVKEVSYLGDTRCFALDFNGASSKFRLRALKNSTSCGAPGVPLPMYIKIRAISNNQGWTTLTTTGTAGSVTGTQSMTYSWNLVTGDPRLAAGKLALHASSDGNIGIGTNTPQAKLDISSTGAETIILRDNDSLVTDPTFTSYIRSRDSAGTPVWYVGDGSSGAGGLWLLNYQANPIHLATAGVTRMTVDGVGNVGIGTTAPSYRFQVGTAADGSEARANAWNLLSDERLKKNFEPIPDALEKILSLNGYFYNWNRGKDKSRKMGVKAQEVEKVFPEVVSQGADGFKSVSYDHLVAPLIESVKILDRRLKVVEEDNQKLRLENAQMKEFMCAQNPKLSFCR